MAYFFQQVASGVHAGALYALLAFGYTLVHGVTRRTNLAHGALFAFGGNTMILSAVFGWQVLWLTMPATLAFGAVLAFLYVGGASLLLARLVFAPLAGRSPNTLVAATLGVALVLMELSRLAAGTRDFWLPPILASPIQFGPGVSLTLMQALNIVCALLAIAALSIHLSRSPFGRAWRAIADDAGMAALCGVDTGSTFRRAVLAGGLCAALAGILFALHYGNIGFGAGLVFGLKVLFVAAAGSYASPQGSAAGAGAFGLAEALWGGYFPLEWRDAAMFALLATWLILSRSTTSETDPRGLSTAAR